MWASAGVRINNSANDFIKACELSEPNNPVHTSLNRLIAATTKSAMRFFTQSRDDDGRPVDVYAFFKQQGQFQAYRKFRGNEPETWKAKLERAEDRFAKSLDRTAK